MSQGITGENHGTRASCEERALRKPEYTTWEQVAGYFDGDGSLKVHSGTYSLTLELSWADQDKEQLEGVRRFLAQKGAIGKISRFRLGRKQYYELSVSQSGNLLLVLKGMFPHVIKKHSQVRAGIDYLENRITGTAFILSLNEAIRLRKRSSTIRLVDIPFTKEKGVEFARRNARLGKSRALSPSQLTMVRKQRTEGMSLMMLATIYKVAPSTIHRSLAMY